MRHQDIETNFGIVLLIGVVLIPLLLVLRCAGCMERGGGQNTTETVSTSLLPGGAP